MVYLFVEGYGLRAEYPDLSKITLMSQSMKNLYALATKVIRFEMPCSEQDTQQQLD